MPQLTIEMAGKALALVLLVGAKVALGVWNTAPNLDVLASISSAIEDNLETVSNWRDTVLSANFKNFLPNLTQEQFESIYLGGFQPRKPKPSKRSKRASKSRRKGYDNQM